MGLKAWGFYNDPSEWFRLMVCTTYGADNDFIRVFRFFITWKEKHSRILTFADTIFQRVLDSITHSNVAEKRWETSKVFNKHLKASNFSLVYCYKINLSLSRWYVLRHWFGFSGIHIGSNNEKTLPG